MYNYKGTMLNIPDGLLKKYLQVTGLPLNDVDVRAFLHYGGCDENSTIAEEEMAVISALQTELEFWG